MADVTDNKKPAEMWLDVFVYAPVGLALEARELIPKLIERGRGQVTGQVSMARMMGEFAVNTGKAEVTKRLGPVQETATKALGDLGLWPSPDGTEPIATTQASTPARTAASANSDGAAAEPLATNAPDVDTLAIPDYDGLAASQVVPRLEGLADSELEAVRTYEAAHRGRKTVLGKIAQLQSA